MPSYQQLLDNAAQQLSTCSDSPRIDAEVLLQDALQKDLAWLISHNNDQASNDEIKTFEQYVLARFNGQPIAYITGQKWFWRFLLHVNESVLIPRPDTETLVEAALEKIPDNEQLKIADLGTGSGAIALAIALEKPKTKVIATDQSTSALAVANKNQQMLLEKYPSLQNIEFIHSNWFEQLYDQCFDCIVSNPPYIDPKDEHLANTDIRFEPTTALVSKKNGLEDLIHLVDNAMTYLNNNGWLLLEHGFDQSNHVAKHMRNAGYQNISSLNDLNGHTRVTLGQKLAI